MSADDSSPDRSTAASRRAAERSAATDEAADDTVDADGTTDDAAPARRRSVTAAERRRKRRARGKGRWWEFPLLVVIAVGVAVLVKTFLVQPFYIPSASMEHTLHGCPGCNGDKVLVNKPVYDLRDPHPGDIVVFKAPSGWDEEVTPPQRNPAVGAVRHVGQWIGVVPPDEMDLIKRIIATGGQTVKCCDASGRVQISYTGPDGPYRSLDEPYIFQNDHQVFGPVTVPRGRLWVMGDHRGDSADSRAHCGGSATDCDATMSTVPVGNVIGKAVLIVWPVSRWATLGEPATFKGHPTGEAAPAVTGIVGGAPLAAAAVVIAPFGWRRRRRRRGGALRPRP